MSTPNTTTNTTTDTVWLSTAEAAKRAGCALRTMQDYATAGRIRSKRNPLSGRLYVDAADLDRVMAGELIEPAVNPR